MRDKSRKCAYLILCQTLLIITTTGSPVSCLSLPCYFNPQFGDSIAELTPMKSTKPIETGDIAQQLHFNDEDELLDSL